MTNYSVIERDMTTTAEPATVAAQIGDFRKWVDWSPWEDLDPQLQRTYSGAGSGVGASYAWSGRKAGAGTMRITSVTPQAIDIDVDFRKPFKSASKVTFVIAPYGSGTHVVWRMRTPRTVAMRLFGLLMNLDKSIGGDLARGLDRLQAVVEK